MKDMHNHIALTTLTAAAVLSGNSTSAAVDLQGFQSVEIIVATGAIAGDGNFTTVVQESDTTAGGDFTPVAATDLIGALPAALEADSAASVGYIGGKRYIRVVTTRNSGTSIAASIVAMKGHADISPTA